MAITFVGSTTGVTGNNASVTPTIHGSALAGDTAFVFASSRNTAATVVVPAGWTTLLSSTHAKLFYRLLVGGDANPVVTFTGGAAGDDTLAQCAVFRGVNPASARGTATITNASAANIALPTPITPTRGGCLLLTLGWKQDDWTSVATLASQTEIGETFSTTGNDAGQVWDYSIQTTAAASPTGPFTVTGGASAVSKGWVIALDQATAIAAAVQDVYPPRVLVSVTGLVLTDSVEVYRVVSGVRTLLRGGTDDSVSDVSFLRVDAEQPFGVPVSYVAVVEGVEYATGATTYTLTGGKVAVSDALSGLGAEVVILTWPDRQYDRQASTFKVGGRNVVVSGDLGMFAATIELYTEATSSRDNLWALLRNATEGVVQLRQPGGYDGVDSYLAVLQVRERRFSQDGTDQRRVAVVQVAEVDKWADALEAQGFTLADIADTYTGQTLHDLSDDFPTLLALAQGQFG